MEMGVFGKWQPEYAARGLPTFPVKITANEKRPAIRGYMKVGSLASKKLAKQFADASAFGLVCGRVTGLTVLDVDSKDEQVLADALARHGETPFVVRTGSGNFQAWYRHRGEKRQVRPWGKDLPIDQLGDGYVVAPPSKGTRMAYEIVHGTLDDLPDLPFMQNAWRSGDQARPRTAHEGERNKALWWHCMHDAHDCDTFDDLLDVARTFNEDSCIPPLEDEEVVRVARSAWKYTMDGTNRIGRHGAWLSEATLDGMVKDPYLTALIAWLQAKNGPDAQFWVADGLNPSMFDWPRRQFQRARRNAVRTGWIVPLTKPKPGEPVEYRWGDARKQR
ncbi:bifunctional DNA primase/polymerase [Afipia sp. 1NLS2]|uniref:bifunctional DNA primase/polymerase n=1 Tax=Afipia sp. 1NLS2 TaxID=666684 RepID=UPI0001D9EC9D|nr:bifunctional DNA primase/polymerase [Afipia sp. 1NLS2]EFI50087.1 Primase 1 [Afipia sp. 1NLS2]